MIFIMGGHGFVGSAFARLFQRRGVPFEIITRGNYDTFKGRRCDILVNANGNSKKFLADRDPLADFAASVNSVAKSLHDFTFERYILCSTCDVYHDLSDPKLNHEDVDIQPHRLSRYGHHKYLAEQLVQREADNYLIIRFGGFVGEGLKKNPIYDILHGGPLWLDPDSELQYIRTDTAAEAVWHFVEKGQSNEIVNVCGNGLVKLRDVMNHFGREVAVQEGSPQCVYQINIDKIQVCFPIPDSRDTVYEFVDRYDQSRADPLSL
ncbi:MAG: NAD-dependent epimerase/dehydratase family protein [Phycisphaerae bacterium]